MKEFNAYHFVGSTLRDGSPVPENGVKLIHSGNLELYRSGFHASSKVWQALTYAPGHTLCRVMCEGEVINGADKLVCTERTVVQRIDAENLLYSNKINFQKIIAKLESKIVDTNVEIQQLRGLVNNSDTERKSIQNSLCRYFFTYYCLQNAEMIEACKNSKKTIDITNASLDPCKKGQLLYAGCKNRQQTIGDKEPPARTIAGTYHLLSDTPTLGWHPGWEKFKRKK